MKKHFVTFFSPGTFVPEETEKEIESWDTEKAIKMSKDIKERHNAKPYAFQFSTRERKDHELNSKIIKRSCKYFLGGQIYTLDEIKARNNPNDATLVNNMEINNLNRVIENNNSWKTVLPFQENDILLKV